MNKKKLLLLLLVVGLVVLAVRALSSDQET